MSQALATAPQVDAAGDGDKPPSKPAVASAAAPTGTICPETAQPCEQKPMCELLNMTGRAYCVRWVARIRQEAATSRSPT